MKARKIVRKIPSIVYGIIALMIFFTLLNPSFINPINIQNIFKNASVLTIVSMGAAMAILSGKIDLSIGYVMSFSAVVAGMIIKSAESATAIVLLLGSLAGILIGAIFGLFNGIMIGKMKFDYWLVTFASMSIAQGGVLVVSNGNIISGYEKSFRAFADAEILGVPMVIISAIIICGIMIFVTTKTRFGYAVYAVGDSEECAFKSGIHVANVRVWVYLLSGILAGFGGIMLAARTNSASATLGMGYEFNAIAAVIVGGTPFDGGKGGLLGTVFGSILIAVMKSGLQFSGLNSYWQTLLIGVFIMIIIVGDVVSENMRKKKEMRRVYKNA